MGKRVEAKLVSVTPFVTIREAVRLTGLSERYVRRLHHEGKLPHVMSGNRVLVNVPKLMEMMDRLCSVTESNELLSTESVYVRQGDLL